MAKQAFLGENSTGGGHCDEGHFLQSYQPSLCNGWDSEKDLPSTSGYARFGQLTLTMSDHFEAQSTFSSYAQSINCH